MKSTDTIPVLEKAIQVVETAAARQRVTSRSLAEELGIPSATCYRILRTLVRANWLRESGRGEFQLASGLARVARGFSGLEQVLSLWKGPLETLALETGLSVKVSLREGNQAVTLLRAEAARANTISSPVGSRLHLLEAGSAGIILLSELEASEVDRILRSLPEGYWERHSQAAVRKEIAQAAAEGTARAFGTVNLSIYALSAAVQIPDGPLVAVTMVGWPEDFEKPRDAELAARLQETVRRLRKLPEALFQAA